MEYQTYIDAGELGELYAEVLFEHHPRTKEIGSVDGVTINSVNILINDNDIDVLNLLGERTIRDLEDECLGEMI